MKRGFSYSVHNKEALVPHSHTKESKPQRHNLSVQVPSCYHTTPTPTPIAHTFTHKSPNFHPVFSTLTRFFCGFLTITLRHEYVQADPLYPLHAIPLRTYTSLQTTKDIDSNAMLHKHRYPKRVAVK